MTGLTTATVYAQPAETAPSAKVFYGDLNLQSPSGMKTLHIRIHRAALAVCGATDNGVDSIFHNQHCPRVAMSGAMQQVATVTSQQFASR